MRIFLMIMLCMPISLLACTSKNTNKTIYESLNARECIKETGLPNCESGRMSYEEYQRQKQELTK